MGATGRPGRWAAARRAPPQIARAPPLARPRRRPAAASAGASAGASPPPRYFVAIEADGALADAHFDGHRAAFNAALESLGYGCAHWTPAIYLDLLRTGDGTGEGLVRGYYATAGWPVMLPTAERPAFVAKVLAAKDAALRRLVAEGGVPLRPGAAEFVDAALDGGAAVTLLAATASAAAESLVSSATLQLGPARTARLQVFTVGADGGGEGGGGDDGGGAPGGGGAPPPASLDEAMAAAAADAKARAAASFARAVTRQNPDSLGMGVDPAMRAASARSRAVGPRLFGALAAAAGVPAAGGAAVAASHSVMAAAHGAGLLVAAVPPRLMARGGYSEADLVCDGYGAGGGLQWEKLRARLDARLGRGGGGD